MAKKLYGTDPDQVPTNADLGTMAYQDSENVNVGTINTTGDVGINTTSRLTDLTIAHNGHGLGLGYEGATLPALAGLYTSSSSNYGQAYGSLIVQSRTDYSGYSIIFRNNGGEAARFTQSGNLAFPNGQGIDFSASEGGGSSSSVLDDYEEGTWTPSFTNLTIGNGSVFGTYTKIGRSVTVIFGFDCGSTTSVGTLGDITGLPFAASNDYTGFIKVHGVAFDSGSRWYEAVAVLGNNNSNVLVPSITNYNSSISATNPMTWTTNDTLVLTATYTTA